MSRKKRSVSNHSKLFSGSFRSTPCGTLAHIQSQQNNNGNFDCLTAEKRWLSRELLLTQCDTTSTSFLGNNNTSITSTNCPLHHHRSNPANDGIYIACLPFNASDDKQLSLAIGEHLTIVNYHDRNHDWVEVRNSQGQVGWVPQVFIKPLSSLDRHSWFHGKVSRCEAEYLLTQGINGSKLLDYENEFFIFFSSKVFLFVIVKLYRVNYPLVFDTMVEYIIIVLIQMKMVNIMFLRNYVLRHYNN
jgi:hypothetical protein